MSMTDAERLAKNERIKEACKATRLRRGAMDCRVYHLKLHPNKTAKRRLSLMFLEAKWLRNAAIVAGQFDTGFLKTVKTGCPVKTPGGEELRALTVLGSQMKQATIAQIRGDIKALAAAKRKGRKVGGLGFAKDVASINLPQRGTTYDLDFKRRRTRIQNIGWVRAKGFHQLYGFKELANAKLLKKPDGFYLAVTAYFEEGSKSIPTTAGAAVGVDMGVSTHITISDGNGYELKLNSTVSEPDHLRRLQRKLSRQIKGSNNWVKTVKQIRRQYQKTDNRKSDFANKVVHELLKYETVYFQDEMLTSWRSKKNKSRMGRKLQHSALGRIKAKLRNSEGTVMLDRSLPTTQHCPECSVRTKHTLDKREFVCAGCGFTADRDINAANNMIILGKLNTSGTDVRGGLLRPDEGYSFVGRTRRSEKPQSL